MHALAEMQQRLAQVEAENRRDEANAEKLKRENEKLQRSQVEFARQQHAAQAAAQAQAARISEVQSIAQTKAETERAAREAEDERQRARIEQLERERAEASASSQKRKQAVSKVKSQADALRVRTATDDLIAQTEAMEAKARLAEAEKEKLQARVDELQRRIDEERREAAEQLAEDDMEREVHRTEMSTLLREAKRAAALAKEHRDAVNSAEEKVQQLAKGSASAEARLEAVTRQLKEAGLAVVTAAAQLPSPSDAFMLGAGATSDHETELEIQRADAKADAVQRTLREAGMAVVAAAEQLPGTPGAALDNATMPGMDGEVAEQIAESQLLREKKINAAMQMLAEQAQATKADQEELTAVLTAEKKRQQDQVLALEKSARALVAEREKLRREQAQLKEDKSRLATTLALQRGAVRAMHGAASAANSSSVALDNVTPALGAPAQRLKDLLREVKNAVDKADEEVNKATSSLRATGLDADTAAMAALLDASPFASRSPRPADPVPGFDSVDLNGDGVVTRREYEVAQSIDRIKKAWCRVRRPCHPRVKGGRASARGTRVREVALLRAASRLPQCGCASACPCEGGQGLPGCLWVRALFGWSRSLVEWRWRPSFGLGVLSAGAALADSIVW